jgi:hypothetical protein
VVPTVGLNVWKNKTLKCRETDVIGQWKHMLFYRHKIYEKKDIKYHKMGTAEISSLRS